jgi:hypothetical protein
VVSPQFVSLYHPGRKHLKSWATPAVVRELNRINGLEWQTTLTVFIGTQRLFALVANPDRANSMVVR